MAQRRVQVGKPGGIFAPAKMAAAKRKHRDAIRKLKAKGAEFTYYEIINYQGLPQGKMTQIDRLSPAGVGFSNVFFAVTYGPDVFVAPDYANFEDGFPNVYAISRSRHPVPVAVAAPENVGDLRRLLRGRYAQHVLPT